METSGCVFGDAFDDGYAGETDTSRIRVSPFANAQAAMTLRKPYFPVEARPLRMSPGLRPLGTDFGNAAADALYFQRDFHFDHYRATKRTLGTGSSESPLGFRCADDAERAAHEAALSWAEKTLGYEQPQSPIRDPVPASHPDRWERIAAEVQEDLVLIYRGAEGAECVIAAHVCFPSAWRPEALLGKTFREIHAPVPDFAERAETASSLVEAMIQRGPYVRFVWTVSADDHLDHHLDHGHIRAWETGATQGWLRVERQVTVPLPDASCSLFLIRTYLTPFTELDAAQRETLSVAIECMPEAVRRYKNIERDTVLSALRESGVH